MKNNLFGAKAISLALVGLMLSSHCLGEDVIMFRGVPPSSKDLADIMFPEDVGNNQTGKIGGQHRIRGIRVSPSRLVEKLAVMSAAFGFNIEFAFDSDQPLPESVIYLDRVGEMLNSAQAADRGIIIIGHTDASGTDFYNQSLSLRRATSVMRYLNSRHRVSTERLQVIGMGEIRPLSGRDPFDPSNRRVEFHSAK